VTALGTLGTLDPWSTPTGEPPLILTFDTSSKTGGVALCRGFEVLGEETWVLGNNHTSQVLPAAARLCERAGYAVGEVRRVVTATGPGSFTGLRVGASLGKGFAVATGAALVGVPTLDAVAYQHRAVSGALVALVDAGRGQVYAGTYRSAPRSLTRHGDFQVLSDAELLSHVAALGGGVGKRHGGDTDAGGVPRTHAVVWVVGEMWPERKAALAALPKVRVASPSSTLRRPAHLAELGYMRFLAQGAPDPAALQPLYLKRG